MNNELKKKLLVNLPFDDENETRAANYAPTRFNDGENSNDGVLSEGCSFVSDAVSGKALKMEGDGDCVVSDSGLNLSSDWTISIDVKSSTKVLSILYNYDGVDQYQRVDIEVEQDEFVHLAIQRYATKQGDSRLRIVTMGVIVSDVEMLSGSLVGVSISDTNASYQDVVVDNFLVWQSVVSISALYKLWQGGEDVEYYINGVNFKTFGVEVSKSSGLVDALARKAPTEVEWNSYHGKAVSLSRPRYKERTIQLECFLVASSNSSFVEWVNKFMDAFQQEGLQRLVCEYEGSTKPLVYDVYMEEGVEVDKTWNDALMVGTFTLSLIEPSPIKRVFRHICQAADYSTISLNSVKMVDISWGDGDITCEVSSDNGTTWASRSHSYNLHGNIMVRHHYAAAGEYDVVVHGIIENLSLEDTTTNDILIWKKL